MAWIVAYTAARGEYLAWSEAIGHGLEAYYPLFKRRLRRRGGGNAYSPLFPRYIFVKQCNPWFAVSALKHVQHVLTIDDVVSTVADHVIENIKQRQQSGEFDERPEPKRKQPRAKSFKDLKKMLDVVDSRAAA
jgi:transcription antitermination factor NusG